MDLVLVDALLEQIEKGQKIGSTFTSTAFTRLSSWRAPNLGG